MPRAADGPRPLSTDAEEYLSYLAVEKGRAASSISSYRHDLSAYEEFLAGRGLHIAEVAPEVVQDYLAFLGASGLAPSSRARALAAIRGMHAFALEEGGAAIDPSEDLEGPRVPVGLPKALTEAEVERLLAAVTGEDARALRDRALLELLYATGARISELVGLSLPDIDLDAELVRLFGKGSKERIVPVGRPALRAVGAWLGPAGRPALTAARSAAARSAAARSMRPAAARVSASRAGRLRRDDAEALFVSTRGARMSRQAAWNVVHIYAVRAGLADRVTPHVLRHSCATHLLDHGADIRVVQELLGHASITTTQVYTKVSQEHLERAYLAAHPRARARATGHVRSPRAPAASAFRSPGK